jgi:hypothetical protein
MRIWGGQRRERFLKLVAFEYLAGKGVCLVGEKSVAFSELVRVSVFSSLMSWGCLFRGLVVPQLGLYSCCYSDPARKLQNLQISLPPTLLDRVITKCMATASNSCYVPAQPKV